MRKQEENKALSGSRRKEKSKQPPLPEPTVLEINGIPQWEQPNRDVHNEKPPTGSTKHKQGKSKSRKTERTKVSRADEHRGMKTPGSSRLENKLLTVDMNQMQSVGDLTIDMCPSPPGGAHNEPHQRRKTSLSSCELGKRDKSTLSVPFSQSRRIREVCPSPPGSTHNEPRLRPPTSRSSCELQGGRDKKPPPMPFSPSRKVRGSDKTRTRRSSRTCRKARNTDTKSNDATDKHLSLSVLYTSWKDGSVQDLGYSCDTSIGMGSSHSDVSSVTTNSQADEDSVSWFSGATPEEEERLLDLQEEALLRMALERSVVEISLHSDDHSDSTFSTIDSSCLSVDAHSNNGSSYGSRARRPPDRDQTAAKRSHPKPKRNLSGAGCHLSMMGSPRRSSPRRSNNLSRGGILQGFDESKMGSPRKSNNLSRGGMLQSFDDSSDDDDDAMLPVKTTTPSFVWMRDVQTNKWYKKPVASGASPVKTEEDMIIEKVSELSLKDCLASSLREIQSVVKHK